MMKVTIPTSLKDITLRQYKKFLNISDNLKENDRFVNAKLIEIFCKIPLEQVMRLKLTDSEEITDLIYKMFEEKPALVKHFKLNNIEYGFHSKLDDMSLGEYIDLDTFIGDWENIEKAMAVLYRPVVSKLKGKYNVAEYEVGKEEAILDMPMDCVMSSIFFFVEFRIGIIANYDELFGQGGGTSLDAVSQFSTKWGWYQSLYGLADGNVERIESITKLGFHQCFMMLAFMKDKSEVEAKQMKKKFN